MKLINLAFQRETAVPVMALTFATAATVRADDLKVGDAAPKFLAGSLVFTFA